MDKAQGKRRKAKRLGVRSATIEAVSNGYTVTVNHKMESGPDVEYNYEQEREETVHETLASAINTLEAALGGKMLNRDSRLAKATAALG